MKARGGALQAVLRGLLADGLATEVATRHTAAAWRTEDDAEDPTTVGYGLALTPAGYAAVGLDAPDGTAPSDSLAEPEGDATEDTVVATDPTAGADADTPGAVDEVSSVAPLATPPKPFRTGTKQARLVELLSAQGGASLAMLEEHLGWQTHTVRAAITALRKRGHAIARTKVEGGSRYAIVNGTDEGTDAADVTTDAGSGTGAQAGAEAQA